MALIYCRECGQQISDKARVCIHCGYEFPKFTRNAEVMTGKENGNNPTVYVNINNENTNTNASQPQVQPQTTPVKENNPYVGLVEEKKKKNKWVAVLLCYFLGVFGVHRFYEGKIGTGILWFLTGGCMGIGWLIDLIILLCKPNPYYV